jgi:molecular chaperone HscA
MALLQISEPGQSTPPHQHRLAVGIDLGTTNSLVATVRNGVPEVLPDGEGRALLPSVVRYHAGGRVEVGHAAHERQSEDPRNTLVSVKRFMGRGLADVAHAASLPYDFVDAPGMVQLATSAGVKTPVKASSEILRVLRERAEETLGGTLQGAVVTVPAYFDDAQRQATKDAAMLAGLNVLRLLNEPTAAAIAYGLDNASEGVYAVYDLGGGTFDFSVLRLSRGVFEVLATGGDAALGGDDFDQRLAAWIEREAGLQDLSPQERRALLVEARLLKERLSTSDAAILRGVSVSRAQFQRMTDDLVAKTLGPTRKALRDAGLAPADVKGVVMVGGATRMPHVQRAVQAFFGREPLNNLDPDKVVALGAAIQANALAGNRSAGEDWLLLDVIPLSLGIETMGGLVERIIPRNSTIPAAKAQEFTTFKDGQTAMAVHVVQGERELVSDCRSLARFELRGIPPMAAGAARIRVTFQVDADGLLSVGAREATTGIAASVMVKPSYGLSDEQITDALRQSFDHAREDMQARALREQQVDAERMIAATEAALAADEDLLTREEARPIRAELAELRRLAAGSDHRALKSAIEGLNRLTEPFAGRRMDRAIQRGLAGRKLEDMK